MFEELKRVKGDFLITYDKDDVLIKLSIENGFQTEFVAMKNTHHAEMQELLISRDLSWVNR